MSLRARTFSSVRWTAGGAIFGGALQFLQIAVLARILSPADYGIMAIVTVVLGFAAIFSDFGFSSAFVHRRDVTEAQRSSLFWLNVSNGIVLMLLVIALSPLLAVFFGGDKRLVPLIMLSSTTFVLSALGLQVRMASEKALQFKPVMIVEVTAALFGFAIALWAAWSDWGVYALVFGVISKACASAALAWIFLSGGWRPALHLRLQDIKPFFGFGGALVVSNIINQFNLTIDLVLGGRILSAGQLGFYSVPRDLTLGQQFIVNRVINRIAFPLISELQTDIDRVRSIYLRTLNMTASTNAPLFIAVAFFTPDVVNLMLGPDWESSVAIWRILALWGCLRAVANPVGSLLMGMGRTDLAMKWNFGLLFITPPLVWLGATYFGAEGIAYALLGLNVIIYIPGWLVLVRPLCRASLLEYSIASLRPVVIAVVALAPASMVVQPLETSLVRLVVGVLLGLFFYLLFSYLGNPQWVRSMMELLGQSKTKSN